MCIINCEYTLMTSHTHTHTHKTTGNWHRWVALPDDYNRPRTANCMQYTTLISTETRRPPRIHDIRRQTILLHVHQVVRLATCIPNELGIPIFTPAQQEPAIPPDITSSSSVSEFKRKLKAHPFRFSYSNNV